MKEYFICPNNTTIRISQCLEQCPFPLRCASKSTLAVCAEQRKWEGKPSCTQLLNGTRQAFLEITQPYAISPDSQMFRILGTKAHSRLEEKEADTTATEEQVELWGITGILDSIEGDLKSDGTYSLIDYKTSGSYKVAQALGITEEQGSPITDHLGNPIYYKSGAKKGQQKYEKIWVANDENAEMRDWILQLNFYKLAWEAKTGHQISDMFIESIVRDGGTYVATGRGIERNLYLIPVPIISNKEVEDFFTRKRDRLLGYLKDNAIPPLCSDEECWEGNKCGKYCPVNEFCTGNPYLK